VTRFEHSDAARPGASVLARSLLCAFALAGGCAARSPGLRQVSTTSGAEPTQSTLACVEFQPEVRFRNSGYDHLVHLRSRCDRRTICAVATDVNPTPVDVPVPPREHVTVLTFRGSPAREFTPIVSCRFAP
jgi:hypothetical protein